MIDNGDGKAKEHSSILLCIVDGGLTSLGLFAFQELDVVQITHGGSGLTAEKTIPTKPERAIDGECGEGSSEEDRQGTLSGHVENCVESTSPFSHA